jgi:hypothetical protein
VWGFDGNEGQRELERVLDAGANDVRGVHLNLSESRWLGHFGGGFVQRYRIWT